MKFSTFYQQGKGQDCGNSKPDPMSVSIMERKWDLRQISTSKSQLTSEEAEVLEGAACAEKGHDSIQNWL